MRSSHQRPGNGLPLLRRAAVLCAPVQDNGGIGWGLLGCCIPIAGLVLYLVWKDQKPRTAKAAGIGALVAVGLSVFWYILVLVGGISFALF